jgi:hypothetical protein
VKLLFYLVYLQLGLGELKPTKVILKLDDRSIKKPRGIIKDVILRVEKFYFPVDFIVLDTEQIANLTKLILVILGRSFLATANAWINCQTRVMKLTIGNMKVKVNIFNAFQHPPDTSRCFLPDILKELVEDSLPFLLIKDPLEVCLIHFSTKDF